MRAGLWNLRERLGVLLVVSTLLAASFATTSVAQVTWQLATEYPQSNISGVGLGRFARLVSARTNGFVTANAAFESSISSGELIRAAGDRRLTRGDAFAGPMEATDPVFGLPSLPFVVQSVAAARAVNTKARPPYEAALTKHGMKLLYITIWPSTGLDQTPSNFSTIPAQKQT